MWTADALGSEHRRLAGDVWRVVESQSRFVTMKIVDDAREQEILESELERSKPAIPPECQKFHWLLSTPFRYAPYPAGSRFRRARQREGCLYASEQIETAIAEDAFYRLLFFLASPAMVRPVNPQERTAFQLAIQTGRGIDLTQPPFRLDEPVWSHPSEYGACQDFADTARESKAQIIRYNSVRDTAGNFNLAVLSCAALACNEPKVYQTWHIMIRADRVEAFCEMPRLRRSFRLADWATVDTRIPSALA